MLMKYLGSGSFARMKNHMNSHVDSACNSMFQASCDHVRSLLKEALRDIKENMENKADEVFVSINRDYRSALGGGDVPQGAMMPKAQRDLRKSVMGLINGAERIFKRIVGIEDDDGMEDAFAITGQTESHPPTSPRNISANSSFENPSDGPNVPKAGESHDHSMKASVTNSPPPAANNNDIEAHTSLSSKEPSNSPAATDDVVQEIMNTAIEQIGSGMESSSDDPNETMFTP